MRSTKPARSRLGLFLAFLGVMVASVTPPHTLHAITITIEHTPEGENPAWDPDGSILTAHFQAAVAIWQDLLPGEGDYSFDYHWDDEVESPTLGKTFDRPFDTWIEFNPNAIWFADPTPNDNAEFGLPTQTLFRQLSLPHQQTYFPGTFPPGTLEVGFRGAGISNSPALNTLSLSGQTIAGPSGPVPVDARNGFDLLSTVVHEIGHVLGIAGTEPGEYNIFPQHVGGFENVLVLEDNDGGHLAGQGIVPFLMCESCGEPGVRRFPTATDVLVIAEDQGIDTVHLDRVDRISSGLWSDGNAWIGGAVPDETQDVSIHHGGPVTLDENRQVKSVMVKSGNSLTVGNHQLVAKETMDFENTTVNIGDGGAIAANHIIAEPASIVTTSASLVQFNQFTRTGSSTATSATFNGNVTVGHDAGSSQPITFNPNPISTWNVGGDLTVGPTTNTTLLINNGTWTVGGGVAVGGILSEGGGLTIQNGGRMTVGGNFDLRGSVEQTSRLRIESNSRLDVAGTFSVGANGIVEVDSTSALEMGSIALEGGNTYVRGGPYPTPFFLERTLGAHFRFDNPNIRAAKARVEGGAGDEAPGGLLTLKANYVAGDAEIHNGPGRKGPSLPGGGGSFPRFKAGFGGATRFEDNASAGAAIIHNEAVTEDYYGTGGRTIFAGDSSAGLATVENFGSTFQTSNAPHAGGVTEFRDRASAGEATSAAKATFTNHFGGGGFGFSGAGHTIFYDQSTASGATLINISGDYGRPWAGETEFRGSSTAANAKIFNRGSPTGHSHSLTSFFDNATAGDATITLNFGPGGGGRTEFNGNSNAGSASVLIEGRGAASSGWGGRVTFNDASSAASAEFTIGPEVRFGAIWFDDQSTGGDATFVMQDNSHANIDFFGRSSAGTANFDIGRWGTLYFEDDSTAEAAEILIRAGGFVWARDNNVTGGRPRVSLGTAQIRVLGANAPLVTGYYGGSLEAGQSVTAGSATIVVEGGTVANAYGGNVNIDLDAQLDHATLIVNGGVPGALGGTAGFYRGGDGVSARVVSNAGANVDVVGDAGAYGDTLIGSIEGAGSFGIADAAHLVTGGLNTDTTISGPITYVRGRGSSGGRLTKIGSGTLTLAGVNTYKGLTTVSAGTLCLTGSLAGGVEVNGGGALKGPGAIGGVVTIHAGGVYTPDSSSLAVGGLNILPGGVFDFDGGELVIAPNVGNAATSVVDPGIIATTTRLNLNNNDLVVRATAATKDALHAQVEAKIVTAQNGLDANFITKWDGPGVTSTSARAANVATGFDLVGLGVIRNSDLDITTGLPGSSYTLFSGKPVTPDDVLVKYTYIGDGNLDGVVSFDDYVGMDNAFFGLIPNLGWATGDINFNSAINFDDYSVVDQAFFFQGAPLTGGVTLAAVPEPATVFLFALALLSTIAVARYAPANRARSAKNAG